MNKDKILGWILILIILLAVLGWLLVAVRLTIYWELMEWFEAPYHV